MRIFQRIAAFFSNIIRAISGFFRALFGGDAQVSESARIDEEIGNAGTTAETTVATPISRKPGINCPECGQHFPVSMEMLLFQTAVQCPYCQLELTINKEASSKALEPLKTFYQKMKTAEEQAKGSGAKV
jgi:ssDNA-binding Zn-finger/Zn-ribbon topoisomerase 1